jgi:Na+-transporting NADH:ubiquinone oxidoreductase subunit E
MFEHYLNIAIKTIFVENMALAFFLGMCTFIAISKKISTAIGLSIAVIVVLAITIPLNQLIFGYLLSQGALSWLGLPDYDLSFLGMLSYIGVIAATVQILEIVLDKYMPKLYSSLGVFLPLITVNCAIMGGVLFAIERDYTLIEGGIYGISAGIGWGIALVLLAGIREKLKYSDMPKGFYGLGSVFVIVGLMSLAFMSFSGIKL